MQDTGSRRPSVLAGAAAGFLLLAVPGTSRALTCDDLCPPNGPCTISTLVTVSPGTVIDCGTRDVTIAGPHGRFEITNGTFTLRTHDLTIDIHRFIQAFRTGPSTVPFGVAIELTGDFDATGYIKASSSYGGGTISVHADGDIHVRGVTFDSMGILARGETADDAGGQVELVSRGNVTIDDPILADNDGAAGEGAGGSLTVLAAGGITINSNLNVHGRGEGGLIRLQAEGAVDLNDLLKADGGGAAGNGGEIHVSGSAVTVDGPMNVHGGEDSEGGTVHLEAGAGGIAINEDVDATGGAGGSGPNGGAIIAETSGNITVADQVVLDSKADFNSGDGGDILLTAGGVLNLLGNARLDARGKAGPGNTGAGATIRLSACDLSIASGASLDVTGYLGGSITLAGRETLTVLGDVDAGGTATNGSVTLAYRVLGRCSNDPNRRCNVNVDCTIGCQTGQCTQTNPNTQGASITPAARLVHDRNLVACY